MSSSRVVDVGTPPTNYSGYTTHEVRFHNFANLSTERDSYVSSPKFSSLHHQWKLHIYPGGGVNSPEGMVAIKLANMSDKSIKIEYGCIVKDANGKEVVHRKPSTKEFGACVNGGRNGRRHPEFTKLSTLIDALIDGTMVIEVRMRLANINTSTPQFIPTNKNVLELFNDEESADIVFELSSESNNGEDSKKKAKTSTTLFAHRLILKKCAPALYEMCGSPDGKEESTSIAIADVKPDIFRHMLHYIYGGKVSVKDLETNAKDIIDACDKYGVVHLKLEAEVCYVKTTKLSIDNVLDNMLYADAKNLALLKEEVMDYIVANGDKIMGKVSFDNVPGSTVTDILAAMARGKKKDNSTDDIGNYNNMRIGALRKMLDEKGLDVDGSREAMIIRLKEQS